LGILFDAEIGSISEIQEVKNYGGESEGAKGESLEVRQWRRVYLHGIQSLLSRKGIKHQLSIPERSEQNGVAERMNPTLTKCSRSIRLQADMSEGFWTETVNHASYLVNWSPSTAVDLQILEEI